MTGAGVSSSRPDQSVVQIEEYRSALMALIFLIMMAVAAILGIHLWNWRIGVIQQVDGGRLNALLNNRFGHFIWSIPRTRRCIRMPAYVNVRLTFAWKISNVASEENACRPFGDGRECGSGRAFRFVRLGFSKSRCAIFRKWPLLCEIRNVIWGFFWLWRGGVAGMSLGAWSVSRRG